MDKTNNPLLGANRNAILAAARAYVGRGAHTRLVEAGDYSLTLTDGIQSTRTSHLNRTCVVPVTRGRAITFLRVNVDTLFVLGVDGEVW